MKPNLKLSSQVNQDEIYMCEHCEQTFRLKAALLTHRCPEKGKGILKGYKKLTRTSQNAKKHYSTNTHSREQSPRGFHCFRLSDMNSFPLCYMEAKGMFGESSLNLSRFHSAVTLSLINR